MSASDHTHEDFNFEPVPGLPENLPEGERVLWRGAPDPVGLVVDALHVKALGMFCVGMTVWRTATALHDGNGVGAALISGGGTLLIGLLALAVVAGAGWLMARETIYTITNRRLVIRHGVAMPMAINIPFATVENAALSESRLGYGNITFQLAKTSRASMIALWPHIRPMDVRRPEPMLRGIVDAPRVARLVAQALAIEAGQPQTTTPDVIRTAPAAERPAAHPGMVTS